MGKPQPDSDGWILQFEDLGEVPWQCNCFFDGRSAKAINTQKGNQMIAGPEPKNDAHHAVLWKHRCQLPSMKFHFERMKLLHISNAPIKRH